MTEPVAVSVTWPRRRPLSPSELRLRQLVTTNVRSELVGKVSLTALAIVLNSPWMWLLWATQFAVLGGVWLARTALERSSTDRALLILVCSHSVGGLGAVIALPDIAPLVMLVLFGDLTLSGFATRTGVRPYLATCLAMISAVALLSLSRWSDLRDDVPIALVVVAFAIQGLASGWITATSSRETYTRLRDRGERLRSLTERMRTADRDERLSVANRLSAGTIADLGLLRDRVADIHAAESEHDRRAHLAAGATLAKRSLARLRELSHGLYPDVLHQHGLAAAIASLDALAERDELNATARAVLASHPPDRLPGTIESAFYACTVAALPAMPPGAVLVTAVEVRDGWAELLLSGPGFAPDAGVEAALRDQASAVSGEMALIAAAPDAVVHVAAPLAPPVAAGPSSFDVQHPVPILRRFIDVSVLLCGIGLPVSAAVWVATRSPAVAVVFGVLCVVMASVLAARAAERRANATLALALLSFETSFAGIAVTAAVPDFAPVSALIVTMPLILGLPHLAPRHLDAVGMVQTLMITAVVLLGLLRTGVVDDVGLPLWVPLTVLAPASLAVASLVVVALADGRAATDAANERLQAALRELLVTFDTTRHRIERDLHDGAQQHLAALAIQFGVGGKLVGTPERVGPVLDRVAQQIDEARAQLQMLVDGSFGDTVRTIGLATALERTAALAGRPVNVTTVGTEQLPDHLALVTYFACHEAIQNATKHAGATAAIDVDIRTVTGVEGSRVEFSVTDDGHGCEQAHLESGRGMRSLRQRIEEVGGVLDAASAPGRGTSLTGVIPVRL